ncbi:hypothetical protein OROGR_003654 [Orobanche gracilis]
MIVQKRHADSLQAVAALSLQTVTMATKVDMYFEGWPSTSCLQDELEASRKHSAELSNRLEALDKASLEAEKKANHDRDRAKSTIDQMRERVIVVERSLGTPKRRCLS